MAKFYAAKKSHQYFICFVNKHCSAANTIWLLGTGGLVSWAQDHVLIDTIIKLEQSNSNITSLVRQSRTREALKPPNIRKIRDHVPPTKCNGTTFGRIFEVVI